MSLPMSALGKGHSLQKSQVPLPGPCPQQTSPGPLQTPVGDTLAAVRGHCPRTRPRGLCLLKECRLIRQRAGGVRSHTLQLLREGPRVLEISTGALLPSQAPPSPPQPVF